MSVPLERLYHYLDDCVNHDLLIYRWLPHGSKKLEDLNQLMTYSEFQCNNWPIAVCHDQEPLNYDFYSPEQIRNCAKTKFLQYNIHQAMVDKSVLDYLSRQHFRGMACCTNQYDLTILVHSEWRSVEVDVFEQAGFVPVYYWSHAIIAQD